MTTPFDDVTNASSGVRSYSLRSENITNSSKVKDPWLYEASGCFVVNSAASPVRDDSKDVVSTETINFFNALKGSVLLPALIFFGVPTNILNLVVFCKHGLHQRINLCLFSLSAVDLFFLTLLFFMYVEQIRSVAFGEYVNTNTYIVRIIINYHILGCYGFGWSSQFVSAVIALDRCFCVLWPLKSGTLMKTRSVGIVLLVGIVVITGGCFIVTEKFRVVCVLDALTGTTMYVLSASAYYIANKRLVDVLEGVVYGMVIPIGSCTTVAVATAITAFVLRKSLQFRHQSSSSLPAREIALTKMLIYLSLQFIITNLPNILLRISLVFLPDLNTDGAWFNLFFLMIGVVEVCSAFNSSLNVLVYYFTGSKYRATVHAMLCVRPGCMKKKIRDECEENKTEMSTMNTVL